MTDPRAEPERRRRLAISVRTRIVTAITAVTAIGLLAVGVSVYLVERQLSLDEVDARLRANLASARFIVEQGDLAGAAPGTWLTATDALRAVVERMSPDDNTGAMGLLDGTIGMVPGIELDLDLREATTFADHVHGQITNGKPVIGTYAEDSVAWRYLAVPVRVESSPAPQDAVFVLAYDLDAELREFNESARVFTLASVIVLFVVAATGTIVATRLLHPLRQVRETALRVTAKSLTERIPVVGNDDVAELSVTMNDMLDRIDDAVTSQRSLLSDVGHELKTPITIVRGHVEVMDPVDVDDVRETQLLVLDELDRMDRLVQDLTAAAALHGPRPIHVAPVDVSDLVDQIARKAEGITGARIGLDNRADGVALLDAERVTQAMLQLVQNAVVHGGGVIEISSDSLGQTVRLSVRDHGDGVPDSAKERIFRRFERGAGTEHVAGSGLGLNIVQVIARAHEGSVRVTDASPGAIFTLDLPRGISDGRPAPGSDARGSQPSVAAGGK